MKTGVRSTVDHIEGALEAARIAWWEIELPSGALRFSRFKTDVLGYEYKDFVHYTHFTDLIHPDDYDSTMKAMSDHYTGKAPLYETTYRIKASDGSYRTFKDKGQVVEKTDEGIVVAGVVIDITDET